MRLNPWLGDRRGYLTDWVTQLWVRATGSHVDLAQQEWLAGPTGKAREIGGDFFAALAERERLQVRTESPAAGLMDSFAVLSGPDFDASTVHPEVRDFYEKTARYRLEVWSEWSGVFRPFGHLLASMFSRRLQQLNMPLTPSATTCSIASSVVVLDDPSGQARYTGWVRRNRASGDVVYVGAYSVTRIPGNSGPCVKVVFPLPNGSATVFMRPRVDAHGSLVLDSVGRGFGDPGFYFLVHGSDGRVWVRFLRTFRERIRVYVDSTGDLRTDHFFTIWRRPFLRLHYQLHLDSQSAAE